MPEDENPTEETTASEPIKETPKTEEPAAVEKPVIETPQPETPVEEPVPQAEETPAPPIPEPLPEPAPSAKPEPIIETPKTPAFPKVEPKPEPKPAPDPEPTPTLEPEKPEVEKPEIKKPAELPPTPSHLTEKQIKRDVPVAPAKHDPKYTKGIPNKVLELTAEEINAARLLWAREHIGEAQAQSNRNRTVHMNRMMDKIETFVKANTQTTTHAIANSVNLSERSTSGYIQKLVKAGRIKATGNSHNRRYFG